MKRILLLVVLLSSFSAFGQQTPTQPPAKPPDQRNKVAELPKVDPNVCRAVRLDGPPEDKCGITCDTGQEARCVSPEKDDPAPPVCQCLKAQGVEGVNPFSSCHATKKNAKGQELERCSVACDKRTVATCVNAPDDPATGSPRCSCEKKSDTQPK